MAKEIPYFKFYIGDWANGDITLESFELQGVFINVCAYYWSKDCSVSLENVKKKFRLVSESIDDLIKCNCIKKNGENISISFLNEQMESKEVQKAINRNNGLKGGRPPKEETEKKPNGLIFDNQNITNIEKSKEEEIREVIILSDAPKVAPTEKKINIHIEGFDLRKNDFKKSLYEYTNHPPKHNGPYSKEMVLDFFKYWTEPNKSKSKMKWEMQKTWDLSMRISNWSKNDFGKSKSGINGSQVNNVGN